MPNKPQLDATSELGTVIVQCRHETRTYLRRNISRCQIFIDVTDDFQSTILRNLAGLGSVARYTKSLSLKRRADCYSAVIYSDYANFCNLISR